MKALDHPVLHMAAGFLAMGGWAVFANRGHPMPAPLLAGLVQGVLTACITLGLKRLIEALVSRLEQPASLILPPLAAFTASAGLLSIVHNLAGTPEVLQTMLIPVAVATTYAILYTLRINRRAT